jgi:hypothetical protein
VRTLSFTERAVLRLTRRTAEEIVFPFLNQKLDFSGEQAAHVVIHTHLDGILESIRAAQADHSKFDPAGLKAAMEAFKAPLVGVSSSSVSLRA